MARIGYNDLSVVHRYLPEINRFIEGIVLNESVAIVIACQVFEEHKKEVLAHRFASEKDRAQWINWSTSGMKNKKQKQYLKPFTTAHKLAFESSLWHRSDDFMLFRIGTCHGTWRSTPVSYDILNIINEEPGNGHFEDVLQWFEYSCRRDGKALRILEILQKRFQDHLVNKRGFRAFHQHCIKLFL